jgi:hypothetical protein
MTQASRPATPPPRVQDVVRDIEDLRGRVLAAFERGEAIGQAAQAAYGPALSRRLQLLAALRDGRSAAWRDYPPAPRAVALSELN